MYTFFGKMIYNFKVFTQINVFKRRFFKLYTFFF